MFGENILRLVFLFSIIALAVLFTRINQEQPVKKTIVKEEQEHFVTDEGEVKAVRLESSASNDQLIRFVHFDVYGFYPSDRLMPRLRELYTGDEEAFRKALQEQFETLVHSEDSKHAKYKAIITLYRKHRGRVPDLNELDRAYNMPLSETHAHLKQPEASPSRGQVQPVEEEALAEVSLNRNLEELKISCQMASQEEKKYKDFLLLPPQLTYKATVITPNTKCTTPLCEVRPSTDQTSLIGTLLD